MTLDSDSDGQPRIMTKLFGRQRSLHSILGGGIVADVLLWRNYRLSGAILAVVTVLWLLFEVAEYNFLTLLCHLTIALMFLAFIYSNVSFFFDRESPRIPEIILSEQMVKKIAMIVHTKLNRFLVVLYDIARGNDLKMFLLVISSLWIISVLGSCCDSGNLLYFGFVFVQMALVAYERHEDEVDHIFSEGNRDLKNLYRKFDRKVLDKIPRGGPVKEKKKNK